MSVSFTWSFYEGFGADGLRELIEGLYRIQTSRFLAQAVSLAHADANRAFFDTGCDSHVSFDCLLGGFAAKPDSILLVGG